MNTTPLGRDIFVTPTMEQGWFNGGAGNIFKWTANPGTGFEKTITSCDSSVPSFEYNNPGWNIYQVEVTDFWNNKAKDIIRFQLIFSGDKVNDQNFPLIVPHRENLESPKNINVLNEPIATFTAIVGGPYAPVKVDASASQPSDSRYIIHTYRWYRDGELFASNCSPKMEINLSPGGCKNYTVEVEDSLGKKKMSAPQNFCYTGDK